MSEQTPAPHGEVPQELERALAAEISLGSRMRHVAVGLAGGCAAALVTVLWVTEPRPLPARTQAAFAVLVAIGLAWAVFCGWVLSSRRPLYARDRVLAAGLALVVSAVTGVAGTALAVARATTAQAMAVALVGVALVTAAGLALIGARSRRRALLRMRDARQQEPS
ncbi:transmembrane transport protein [Actinomadura sp. SCN-SB]|uniref:transmembrane transport protein n=1 Tax=Actinomadura sp. SCN-SB TaxID=3373092 RepID=UPI003753C1F9